MNSDTATTLVNPDASARISGRPSGSSSKSSSLHNRKSVHPFMRRNIQKEWAVFLLKDSESFIYLTLVQLSSTSNMSSMVTFPSRSWSAIAPDLSEQNTPLHSTLNRIHLQLEQLCQATIESVKACGSERLEPYYKHTIEGSAWLRDVSLKQLADDVELGPYWDKKMSMLSNSHADAKRQDTGGLAAYENLRTSYTGSIAQLCSLLPLLARSHHPKVQEAMASALEVLCDGKEDWLSLDPSAFTQTPAPPPWERRDRANKLLDRCSFLPKMTRYGVSEDAATILAKSFLLNVELTPYKDTRNHLLKVLSSAMPNMPEHEIADVRRPRSEITQCDRAVFQLACRGLCAPLQRLQDQIKSRNFEIKPTKASLSSLDYEVPKSLELGHRSLKSGHFGASSRKRRVHHDCAPRYQDWLNEQTCRRDQAICAISTLFRTASALQQAEHGRFDPATSLLEEVLSYLEDGASDHEVRSIEPEEGSVPLNTGVPRSLTQLCRDATTFLGREDKMTHPTEGSCGIFGRRKYSQSPNSLVDPGQAERFACSALLESLQPYANEIGKVEKEKSRMESEWLSGGFFLADDSNLDC